jgi:hypothetical protein
MDVLRFIVVRQSSALTAASITACVSITATAGTASAESSAAYVRSYRWVGVVRKRT